MSLTPFPFALSDRPGLLGTASGLVAGLPMNCDAGRLEYRSLSGCSRRRLSSHPAASRPGPRDASNLPCEKVPRPASAEPRLGRDHASAGKVIPRTVSACPPPPIEHR
jgi:hypothetical protein